MSQEKVDRYKKEKANRKQVMKKEKIQGVIRKCVIAVVVVALVGWIGFSAYDKYDSSRPVKEVQIDYQSVDSFSQELSTLATAQE